MKIYYAICDLLIVSNDFFNSFSAMYMICPITKTDKSHPFHIPLDDK